MKINATPISDVFIIEPTVHSDERGFFFESYNERQFEALTGIVAPRFVQDNYSRSVKNVLRGLHYQIKKPQGKLIRAVNGSIFDVAVDIREGSNTFGKWVGVELSAENKRALWIPPGFAHGFVVISDSADVSYKVTEYWAPEFERCILWSDPAIAIDWPIKGSPLVSGKDKAGTTLRNAIL